MNSLSRVLSMGVVIASCASSVPLTWAKVISPNSPTSSLSGSEPSRQQELSEQIRADIRSIIQIIDTTAQDPSLRDQHIKEDPSKPPHPTGWELWKQEIPALLHELDEKGIAPLTSPSGFTLLQAACFYDKKELAAYLITHGVPINKRPPNYETMGLLGDTPLGLALRNWQSISNDSLLKLLLENGADPDAPMISFIVSERTYRDIPLNNRRLKDQTKLILLEYGNQDLKKRIGNRTMMNLTLCNFGGGFDLDYDYAEALLKRGFPPDSRGEKGHTLLVNATMRGDLPLAELLLKHGANPNLRSGFSGAPLFNLLDNRPIYNEKTKLLKEKRLKNAIPMAKLLIKYGADINVMTYPNTGESLRTHYGKIKGAEPIVEFLKESGAKLYPDDHTQKPKKKQGKKRS